MLRDSQRQLRQILPTASFLKVAGNRRSPRKFDKYVTKFKKSSAESHRFQFYRGESHKGCTIPLSKTAVQNKPAVYGEESCTLWDYPLTKQIQTSAVKTVRSLFYFSRVSGFLCETHTKKRNTQNGFTGPTYWAHMSGRELSSNANHTKEDVWRGCNGWQWKVIFQELNHCWYLSSWIIIDMWRLGCVTQRSSSAAHNSIIYL